MIKMKHRWKPAVTVAAVIEHEGRFLLVEEESAQGLKINQPAGHLEARESLLQAVAREVLEETAHPFAASALIGIYLYAPPQLAGGPEQDFPTYMRFAFCGELGADSGAALDEGIVRTLWLSRDEVLAREADWRSPLVLTCIDDYLAGKRLPLDLLYTHSSVLAAAAETVEGDKHD